MSYHQKQWPLRLQQPSRWSLEGGKRRAVRQRSMAWHPQRLEKSPFTLSIHGRVKARTNLPPLGARQRCGTLSKPVEKFCWGFKAHESGPSPCFAANCHEICSLPGLLAEAGEEPGLGDGPSAHLGEVAGEKPWSGDTQALLRPSGWICYGTKPHFPAPGCFKGAEQQETGSAPTDRRRWEGWVLHPAARAAMPALLRNGIALTSQLPSSASL